jgi:hypothetical protein
MNTKTPGVRLFGRFTPQDDEPDAISFDGYSERLHPDAEPYNILTDAELDAVRREAFLCAVALYDGLYGAEELYAKWKEKKSL